MFKSKETKMKTISVLIITMFCLVMVGINVISADATILTHNLKVKLVSDNDIKVSWTKDSQYDGYRVMYKRTTAKDYTLKDYYTTSNVANIYNLAYGVAYDIQLTPYVFKDGEKHYYHSTQETIKIPSLAKVTIKTTINKNDLKVTWAKISQYDGYRVMYKRNTAKDYTLKDYYTTSNVANIYNLTYGVAYDIKVTPYIIKNGEKAYYDSTYTTIKMPKPTTVTITPKVDKNNVKVSWTKNTLYDGYRVMYKETFKDYVLVGYYSNVANIYNLKYGEDYTIKVTPYVVNNGKKVYYDSTFKKINLPNAKKISAKARLVGNDDIKVTWTKSTQYDGYKVMYKKASKSIIEYQLKGFYNSSSSTTLNNLSDGITYIVKVTPYTVSNDKKVYYTSAADTVQIKTINLNKIATTAQKTKSVAIVPKDAINPSAVWISYLYTENGPSRKVNNPVDFWLNWKASGSTSKKNIPVGAVVIGSGKNKAGDAAIYLGSGKVACIAGKTHKVTTLENWIKLQTKYNSKVSKTGYVGWVIPGVTK